MHRSRPIYRGRSVLSVQPQNLIEESMFEKGREKTGGRKKGTLQGRQKAIGLLDTLFSKAKNIKTLKIALQAEFDTDPISFFRRYAIDLAPKQAPSFATGGEWADRVPADIAEEMMSKTIGQMPCPGVKSDV